ncbi:MAG: helix-turn-helix domain-containing protein [bacterium]|nr:helix-turn-helix domain-containing protein [bacterium]
MITSLGKFLRKLRIDKGELLRDMAQKLGVSSSFLSAVENGKKKMPEAWLRKFRELYCLTDSQFCDLKEAVNESVDAISLNMSGASPQARSLAITFARRFDSLDDKSRQKILHILNKSNKEG